MRSEAPYNAWCAENLPAEGTPAAAAQAAAAAAQGHEAAHHERVAVNRAAWLLHRAIQVLSLLIVTSVEFVRVAAACPDDVKDLLTTLRFRHLATSPEGERAVKALVLGLMREHQSDGTVDALCRRLLAECPHFFDRADELRFVAEERMLAARATARRDSADQRTFLD